MLKPHWTVHQGGACLTDSRGNKSQRAPWRAPGAPATHGGSHYEGHESVGRDRGTTSSIPAAKIQYTSCSIQNVTSLAWNEASFAAAGEKDKAHEPPQQRSA